MPADAKRVQSVFLAAVEAADPAARAAVLDRECGDDAELRRRVEALLKAHDESGSLLDKPAAGLGVTVDSQPGQAEPEGGAAPGEAVGSRIGPYKLLQKLGEGGMGTVWVAEQTEPVKRRVALKVIKPGMDSEQVLRRFAAERQALALMDHTNIARVFDAGTTESGWPYFVMELVKGVPITKYCDELHLPIRERLALFVPVCQAIQHAHQKGVVHRDVKPSNVLVCMQDGKPVPKVIDFGVAKALHQRLTDQSMYTEIGQVLGTLEYMSPEQAELSALDIDTRADVYALGVLLYELLTGSTPLDRKRLRSAAFSEMLRIIKEEEPPKPSTRLTESQEALASLAAQRRTEPGRLAKELRGELDWIAMKCLEKDRTRRYETASGLARDVERYLHDEPVEAGPPSAGYRLRKLLRKHRLVVLTAAAFALLLLAAAAVSSWLAVWAFQAEAVATDQRNAALTAEQDATKQRDNALQAKLTSDRRRYDADLNLGQLAWEDGRVSRLRELLDGQRPERTGGVDFRGFEWNYWNRLLQRCSLLKLDGHTCVAYSPDGKRLAFLSGGADNTPAEAHVCDAQTGKVLHRWAQKQHTKRLVVSPDGKHLVCACEDSEGEGSVRIRDLTSGTETRILKYPARVLSLAFSADGKRLVTCSRDIGVLDWVTGQQLRVFQYDKIDDWFSAAFSPDGGRLVACSYAQVVMWDVGTGKVLLESKGHDIIDEVLFSPDGRRLALGNGHQGTIDLLDSSNGEHLFSIQEHGDSIGTAAYSPDGALLASGSTKNGTITLWDARLGLKVRSFKGHTDGISQIAFSPDGTRIASATYYEVRVWDITTPQSPVVVAPEKARIRNHACFALSADAKFLACANPVVCVLEAATGREVWVPPAEENPRSVGFSPDGRYLAAAFFATGGGLAAKDEKPGWVRVWDWRVGQEVFRRPMAPGSNAQVVFSPDGRLLACLSGGTTGGSDQPLGPFAIRVWDAESGKERWTLKDPSKYLAQVAFSPDGSLLVVSGGKNGMVLLDSLTGRLLRSFEQGGSVVAFSPDGKRLAMLSGTDVTVIDVGSGQEEVSMRIPDWAGDLDLAFSPDGKRVVFAWRDELKFWDLATGQEVLTLKGGATRIAFSRDGHLLAGLAGDGTIRIWDATPRENERGIGTAEQK